MLRKSIISSDDSDCHGHGLALSVVIIIVIVVVVDIINILINIIVNFDDKFRGRFRFLCGNLHHGRDLLLRTHHHNFDIHESRRERRWSQRKDNHRGETGEKEKTNIGARQVKNKRQSLIVNKTKIENRHFHVKSLFFS